MTPRPDAEDLHMAAPRVRADDAFVVRLAEVAATATARERRPEQRGSTLRVAFAAASVAAILTGGTWTAGQLMGADPRSRREAPPVDQSAVPTASVAAASPPTSEAHGSDDADGRRDLDDEIPGMSDPAAAGDPDGADGTDVAGDPGKAQTGDGTAAGTGSHQGGSEPGSPPGHEGEDARGGAGDSDDDDQGNDGDESDVSEHGSEDGGGDDDGLDRADCSPRQRAGFRSSTSDGRVRQTVPRGGPVDDGGREGGCRG